MKKEEILLISKKSIELKCNESKENYEKCNNNIKNIQINRNNNIIESNKLLKQQSSIDISIERARSSLHDILRKAQVEEISLPVTIIKSNNNNGSGGSGSGSSSSDSNSNTESISSLSSTSRKYRKSTRKSIRTSNTTNSNNNSDNSDINDINSDDSEDEDEVLKWTGSIVYKPNTNNTNTNNDNMDIDSDNSDTTNTNNSNTEDSNINSDSDSQYNSTHFSQTQNATVLKDKRKASRVDLTSVKKMNSKYAVYGCIYICMYMGGGVLGIVY